MQFFYYQRKKHSNFHCVWNSLQVVSDLNQHQRIFFEGLNMKLIILLLTRLYCKMYFHANIDE